MAFGVGGCSDSVSPFCFARAFSFARSSNTSSSSSPVSLSTLVRLSSPCWMASTAASVSFSGSIHSHPRAFHATPCSYFLASADSTFSWPEARACGSHAAKTRWWKCRASHVCRIRQLSRSDSRPTRADE